MSEQELRAEFDVAVDLRRILAEQGLDDNGHSPHSWRCEYPDRYPDACTCVADIIDAILAAGYRKRPEPEITDKVVAMVRDMVDPDDCWFDHNGGCQAHGYISLRHGELCPQAEAKAWLASLAVPVGAEEQA